MRDAAAEVTAQACRWAARLDRGLNDIEREELARWLEGDARRQGALVRARAAMTVLARGRALACATSADDAVRQPTRRLVAIGGVATIAALVAGSLTLRPTTETFRTEHGEIRQLPLEDGSMAVVNTDSRIGVRYTDRRRDVTLTHGEAWFKVAKHASRPFVVAAGSARIQAVGTAFDVRRTSAGAEIVVTEGIVRIYPLLASDAHEDVAAGRRARVDGSGRVAVERLSGDGARRQLAWREGQVVLADTPLSAAAEEFNRYNRVQLAIDPSISGRKVDGWFRTDDVDGFAAASATVVGGRVVREGSVIRIVR